MSYQEMSIYNIVQQIEDNMIYLPALQRKFVWSKHQIQELFDSIMRYYPIGTFLFWKLKTEKAGSYVFYEFLKEYDQRNPYNRRKEGHFLKDEIIGVLDGQQRLSSIYIGLQGTHTEKVPYKKTTNENAYEKTRLYLNLLSLPYEVVTKYDDKSQREYTEIVNKEENNFEFKFLTDNPNKTATRKVKYIDGENEIIKDEYVYWFEIGEVLDITWGNNPNYDFIMEQIKRNCTEEEQINEIQKNNYFIRRALQTLDNRIRGEKIINYFEILKDDLEDILKIFIRVNSGGTQLNKTDLLFSTIVATWEDGRERIEDFLKHINRNGQFNFTNEYLMRSCLVLSDSPVLYKVQTFKSENVQKIKDEWLDISNAISRTVDLLNEFGFNGNSLTSQNATIVISYYIYKGGKIDESIKQDIKKYLVHALLNGIYGSAQDSLISLFRKEIKENIKQDFSFEKMLAIDLPLQKSLKISEKEIDRFLTYKKGASSFQVLTLLYPNLKYLEVQFHQDHIHPFSKFEKKEFSKINLSEEQIAEYINLRDMIPNLQLLEGKQNISKNDTLFVDWLKEKELNQQEIFINNHYIPKDEILTFDNFINFFNKRKSILKTELMKIFSIKDEDIIIENEIFDKNSEEDMESDEFIKNNEIETL